MSRNLLILYLSCGAGHRQAALAVREAAERRGDWDRIECVDVAKFYAPWFRSLYQDSYITMVRYLPSLVDWLWSKPPGYSERQAWTFPPHIIRSGASRFFDFIESLRPAAIACTEVAGSELLELTPESKRSQSVNVAVLIDFGAVDPVWIKPATDFYCVPTKREALLVKQMGIAEHRILVTGVPVRSTFSESRSPALRAKLGLPVGPRVVLFMAGGMTGRLLKGALVQSLSKIDAIHVVLAGTNNRDANELRAIRHPSLRVLDWTDRVAEWMSVSDVLISKPGGMTLAEAFLVQVPLILFKPLGWWERANMRVAVESGAAVATDSLDQLPDMIADVLCNPIHSLQMREAGSKLACPSAAENISDLLSQTKETNALAK